MQDTKLPSKLFHIKTKNTITHVCLSNDWHTKTPWQHKGNNVGYISFRKESSKKNNVTVTMKYVYIGPFAIISGKRLEHVK
jgi:hypothetical protein